MAEPTCRSCYAATLTPDELDRFNAEPPTSCVYLCSEHQAGLDEQLALLKHAFIDLDLFPDAGRRQFSRIRPAHTTSPGSQAMS